MQMLQLSWLFCFKDGCVGNKPNTFSSAARPVHMRPCSVAKLPRSLGQSKSHGMDHELMRLGKKSGSPVLFHCESETSAAHDSAMALHGTTVQMGLSAQFADQHGLVCLHHIQISPKRNSNLKRVWATYKAKHHYLGYFSSNSGRRYMLHDRNQIVSANSDSARHPTSGITASASWRAAVGITDSTEQSPPLS